MHRHTPRHTKVKTVYPPVSLRSLGGYNKPAALSYGIDIVHCGTSHTLMTAMNDDDNANLSEVVLVLEVRGHESHRLDGLVHLRRDRRCRRLGGTPSLTHRHPAIRTVGTVNLRQVHLLRLETSSDVRSRRLQRHLSTARNV